MVGNSDEDLVHQLMDLIRPEAHGVRTDLFMISDDGHFLGKGKGHQAQDVALAGLIDNDDVELRRRHVKAFDHA